jgi:hypothetical protein
MELLIYPLLSTRSRRAISRARGKYGRPYDYRPRIDLINNLAADLRMSQDQVLDQIKRERDFILAQRAKGLPLGGL